MTNLVLPLRVTPMAIDDSIITRPSSILKAFTLAADLAGLEDKQAADAAGMDAATWSRFKSGQVGMKPDYMDRYFDVIGNELPLHHMAYRRGYQLVPRLSEMERRLAEERQKREAAENENRVLRSVINGRSI